MGNQLITGVEKDSEFWKPIGISKFGTLVKVMIPEGRAIASRSQCGEILNEKVCDPQPTTVQNSITCDDSVHHDIAKEDPIENERKLVKILSKDMQEDFNKREDLPEFSISPVTVDHIKFLKQTYLEDIMNPERERYGDLDDGVDSSPIFLDPSKDDESSSDSVLSDSELIYSQDKIKCSRSLRNMSLNERKGINSKALSLFHPLILDSSNRLMRTENKMDNFEQYKHSQSNLSDVVQTSTNVSEGASIDHDLDLVHKKTYQNDNIDGWRLEYTKKPLGPRSTEEIRNEYLSKICNTKKQKSHQNVFIFDWDDTLLVDMNRVSGVQTMLSSSMRAQLHKLDNIASSILKLALTYHSEANHVYIVTNAEKGWVEHCAQNYMPNVYNILPEIKVISARSRYQEEFPYDCEKWKLNTFLDIKPELDDAMITNLIVMGDSKYEMNAGAHLAKCFSVCCLKTIKLNPEPTCNELYKQLSLILHKFEDIINSPKTWSINLEKS